MLSIKINGKEHKLEVITVRKLNQTIAFKKKLAILEAQPQKDEEDIINAMLEYIETIYSIKKGEEIIKPFTVEDILDSLPVNKLQSTFTDTLNGVMDAFSEEAEEKN